MTRPDDEYPPLDVTSTLHMGSLDEALEGTDADVVPSRVAGSLPPGMALLVVRRGPNAGARVLLDHDITTSGRDPDSASFLDDGTGEGSLPPGMALLVVRRGPNAGARFLLDHDITTSGRHPDSDIFLDDVTVSRRHAEVHRARGRFTVRYVR